MNHNVGGLDRTLRIITGLALIISTFIIPAMNPWGWIGIVLLVTGLLRWCPAYLPFGIKSNKTP